MLLDLMKDIVVWQKAPDDRAFIFDGEEGMPYFLPDGSLHLAIVQDGKIIDSIPLDITKRTMDDKFDIKNDHRFGFWDDGSFRLIADHSIVKRVMHNRVLFKKAGWCNELLLFTLMSFIYNLDTSNPEAEFLSYIGNKNLEIYRYPYIVAQAAAAYEFYLNVFASKKYCRIKVKSNTDSDERSDAIKLALYISLLNPCVDGPWKSLYNQQGVRGNNSSSCELTIMLEGLKDRMHDVLDRAHGVKNGLNGLTHGFIDPDHDNYNEIWRKFDALVVVTDQGEIVNVL